MNYLFKIIVPLLVPLAAFLFGRFKKSNADKVKDTFDNVEKETLKTQIAMEKAKSQGVQTSSELKKRLNNGEF